MLEVLSYRPGDTTQVVPAADISDLVRRDGRLIWVDLVDPDHDELAQLQEEFDLHPLATEDATKHGQRPKLEQYPTHGFVVAYSAAMAEVDLFIGDGWIVSVRDRGPDGEPWPVDAVRARFERTKPETATVGFLLYVILDELVDGYFSCTDEIEERLEALEDAVFEETNGRESQVQAEVFAVRRRLLEFRRRVVPLREVVGMLLRRELDWVDEAAIVHLQDVYDHVIRVVDLIDTQRELVANAVDAHLAIISNRMNQVMKTMTSWGAILLGSTLVAAIYGMNFEHMPELGWRYGYAFALGLMALVTLFGYRYFRRRDWL